MRENSEVVLIYPADVKKNYDNIQVFGHPYLPNIFWTTTDWRNLVNTKGTAKLTPRLENHNSTMEMTSICQNHPKLTPPSKAT